MQIEIPRELIEQINKNNVVLFSGSGLSIQAGFPNWQGLIQNILSWMEKHGLSINYRDELEKMIARNDLLFVAQELREQMNEQNFKLCMQEEFRDPNKLPTVVHKFLPEIPFQAVLTTNYDVLLESAYTPPGGIRPRTYTQENTAELSDLNRNNQFYILKIHGDIDNINSVVLGRKDYRKVMFSNNAYLNFLKTLFQSRTVLFVGYSLGDPDLLRILDELHTSYQGYGNYHYAVMDNRIGEVEKKRWFQDYNIRIITYEATEGHPEVLHFFKKIKLELEKIRKDQNSFIKTSDKIFVTNSAVKREIVPPYHYEVLGYLDRIIETYEILDKQYIPLAGKTEQIVLDDESDFSTILVPTEFRILEKSSNRKHKEIKTVDNIEEVLNIHSRFVLLGAPGSGKTTTLWKILLRQAKLAQETLGSPIPLLIDLAEWADDINDVTSLIMLKRNQYGLPHCRQAYFNEFLKSHLFNIANNSSMGVLSCSRFSRR